MTVLCADQSPHPIGCVGLAALYCSSLFPDGGRSFLAKRQETNQRNVHKAFPLMYPPAEWPHPYELCHLSRRLFVLSGTPLRAGTAAQLPLRGSALKIALSGATETQALTALTGAPFPAGALAFDPLSGDSKGAHPFCRFKGWDHQGKGKSKSPSLELLFAHFLSTQKVRLPAQAAKRTMRRGQCTPSVTAPASPCHLPLSKGRLCPDGGWCVTPERSRPFPTGSGAKIASAPPPVSRCFNEFRGIRQCVP